MIIRRKLVAGNWKMHTTVRDGLLLVEQIKAGLPSPLDCDVIVAPPFTHLMAVLEEAGNSGIQTAAQNCHTEPSGAYTGEVSILMLKELGMRHVITGHSERRQYFNETNMVVRTKVNAILDAGLIPIFCCGESLSLRESEVHFDHVQSQLEESLYHLPESAFRQVIIAYEPIWAIGTGVTASPQQAQEMHAFLRQSIVRHYGHDTGDYIRILYGGSVKADNARMLFSQRDVDGGLVGGASLDASNFLTIIAAACG